MILNVLILGLVWMFVFMTALWIIHLLIKNAAVVDVGWSLGLMGLVILFALLTDSVLIRKIFVVLIAVLAYGRLGFYLLFNRVLGQPEEGRYVNLRKQWRKNVAFRFFVFFQYQTILAVIFSIPFLLILKNPSTHISNLEIIGFIIWIISFMGEVLSDQQLKKFKANPKNKGRVCQHGLWNYSRHPNYFFQWLMWVSYFVMSLHVPYGWVAIIGPIFMGYFLLFVTGIPATEAQSLRSKGALYRKYQKTTSAFVPWFKKNA